MRDGDGREARAIARGLVGGSVTWWSIVIWRCGWLDALLLFGAVAVCALAVVLWEAIETSGDHE